ENSVWIECRLEALHQRDLIWRQFEREVCRLREPDAVLSAYRSFERDDAGEQKPFGLLRPRLLAGITRRQHQIHVNVSIARMTERSHPQIERSLQLVDRVEQFRHAAARHHDVMIDLD